MAMKASSIVIVRFSTIHNLFGLAHLQLLQIRYVGISLLPEIKDRAL